MKSAYDTYALGLRLSHAALLRNLDRFVEVGEGSTALEMNAVAAFIRLYVAFLDVHHRSEDDFIFPALRRNAGGRSTDAAFLDGWAGEHREIIRLGQELSAVASRFGRSTGRLAELALVSGALREVLTPHASSEEQILSREHLPEMLGEPELAETMQRIAKANRPNAIAIAMASFFMSSLEESEQHALLGDSPWIFRKLILGVVGARRMRRFSELVQNRSISV